MGDRFTTEIRIGGKIPREVAKELCSVIATEEVSLEWDGAVFEPNEPEDLVAAVDEDRVLTLRDMQQLWGIFEDLEEFLVEHKIAFDRHHEPKYEYDGELVMFRQDMETAEEFPADTEGRVVVRAGDLQSVIKLLSDDGTPPEQAVAMAGEQLADLTGAGIDKLEALEIVGGHGKERSDG